MLWVLLFLIMIKKQKPLPSHVSMSQDARGQLQQDMAHQGELLHSYSKHSTWSRRMEEYVQAH